MFYIYLFFATLFASILAQFFNYQYLYKWRKAHSKEITDYQKMSGNRNATLSFSGHTKIHNICVIGLLCSLVGLIIAAIAHFVR